MALAEKAAKYYRDKGMNCAEAILHAANDEYGLELDDKSYLMMGPFGRGCGCGKICGAVASGAAVIGLKNIEKQALANNTAGIYKKTADFIKAFNEKMGSDQCRDLRKLYLTPEVRCERVVRSAAEVLELQLNK
jgi:C_GCAxxG_C_C family probable redox protein